MKKHNFRKNLHRKKKSDEEFKLDQSRNEFEHGNLGMEADRTKKEKRQVSIGLKFPWGPKEELGEWSSI